MQDYQHRLILVALLLGVTCEAANINSFTTGTPPKENIYSHMVKLSTDVTACRNQTCHCLVADTGKTDGPWAMKFASGEGLGTVEITNLEPNTEYYFDLTCQESNTSLTLNITTDHDRPSPPEDVQVTLEGKSLKVTWKPPSDDPVPTHHYRITVDNGIPLINIAHDATSYILPNDYVTGNKHTLYVRACYNNFQNHAICSKPSEIDVKFTAAPIVLTSTTGTSTSSTLQSSSIPIIILSFLLISKLCW